MTERAFPTPDPLTSRASDVPNPADPRHPLDPVDGDHIAERKNLQQLVQLRWLAVSGQQIGRAHV
jgi:hypothetical protein